MINWELEKKGIFQTDQTPNHPRIEHVPRHIQRLTSDCFSNFIHHISVSDFAHGQVMHFSDQITAPFASTIFNSQLSIPSGE